MTLRSLLLPLFGLIVGFVVIVGLLVFLTAESQNRLAKESSEHLARSALAVTAQIVKSNVRDYAYWDDTVENIVQTLDESWAEESIGAWANAGLDMDGSLVADGRNEIFYASFDGERLQGDIDSVYNGPQLTALVVAARAMAHSDDGGPQAVEGFVKIDGAVMLAGASAIVREDNVDSIERGGAASVLIFLRRVDSALLDAIEEQFLLADLSLLPAESSVKDRFPASLALRAADGDLVAYLAWRPTRPGSALVSQLAIPGLAAALILSALLLLVMRRFRKATDALQNSHLLLSEQAYSLADQAVALREARDQADAANFAKSQFLALVSHEVRTPLNAIIGFSDIIAQQAFGAKATERYRSYAQDILFSGKHLLNLINDILDLSKIEAGRYELSEEEIEVDACVARCRTLFREKFDEKSLKVTYTPCDLRLYADERAFKQILINLLSNAIKFTPLKGQIDIECQADAQFFTLTVRDNGCGIAKKDQKRVMEPFGQAANAMRSTEGTGLGLSISKSLAELHGGRLVLESALNKGTRVTFSLPASRLRVHAAQLAAGASG